MTPRRTVEVTVPFDVERAESLRAGDAVLLSGTIYTARDAAHERLAGLIAGRLPLPVDLRDQVVYYCGPTPPRPGRPIGSAGPTTASRMDAYTPLILDTTRLRGMIGKGKRSAEVRAAMMRQRAVYFGAIEGTAALLGACVRDAAVVAFPDLGPEAIHRLVVERFPVVVVNDVHGGDVYEEGRARYRRDPA